MRPPPESQQQQQPPPRPRRVVVKLPRANGVEAPALTEALRAAKLPSGPPPGLPTRPSTFPATPASRAARAYDRARQRPSKP